MTPPTDKWRPSLGMITAGMIASVLVLPLVGLLFFRLYENQLLRQTESELIGQAAMLSAIYAREIETAEPDAFPIGPLRPPVEPAIEIDERYTPIPPTLDLALAPILPPRPEARAATAPARPNAMQIGERLGAIMRDTQRTTLAGFRLLDANGVVIAGSEDVGGSFAELDEVRPAMAGHYSVVLRMRNENEPPPPLYSISRGTKIRVFLAMPVFVEDRVRGIVYVSRTPDNIVRNFFREREKLALAALLTLLAAALIGAAFLRTISRPMRDLVRRAEAISRGEREAIGPLPHHGTRELAGLSRSFMSMAKRLFDRSDYLSTFASHVSHELKTPLTSIKGAAELMLDSAMSEEERRKFLSNVLTDAERMTGLLDRLRELARAENPELGGATTLGEVAAHLRGRFESMEIVLEQFPIRLKQPQRMRRSHIPLPSRGGGCAKAETDDSRPSENTLASGEGHALAMSLENALIVFGHLVDNAQRHGASRVVLDARREEGRLVVVAADNGTGITLGNRARVFDAFFTTRRAEGGAGMGLHIVRSMLRAHGGEIRLAASETGAAFELSLPAQIDAPARTFRFPRLRFFLRRLALARK